MTPARVVALCVFLAFVTGLTPLLLIALFGDWSLAIFLPLWSLLCAYAGFVYAHLKE